MIMLIRAFYKGIKQTMKYQKLTFKEAVKEELYMFKDVMGPKLYVKYLNGTAVEGKDFWNKD